MKRFLFSLFLAASPFCFGAAGVFKDAAGPNGTLLENVKTGDASHTVTDASGNPLAATAFKNVGTTSGTVAAGDDSRITGAAQKSSNLSDLSNISTARTNLGLGNSATRNVGVVSGTVAAGDDSRFENYLKVTDLTEPYIVAHKGASFIVPEHTLEAYKYCLAANVLVFDMDMQLLSDGSMASWHDTTVDTDTTASGNVTDYSASTFPFLNMDAGVWLAPAWPNTIHPTLINDILLTFGRNVVYTIEAKAASSTAVSALVTAAQRYRLTNSMVIQSANLGSLAPAVSAGIKTGFITDSPTPSSIVAAGVNYVVMSNTVADSVVTSCVSAGLKVWVYNAYRQWDWDHFTGLGAVGIMSDDPLYTSRGNYKLTSDRFAQQTWYPGQIAALAGDRGVFISPNRWGFNQQGTRSALLGQFCPITATSYTITLSITWDLLAATDTRYVFLHICEPDDRPYYLNSGGRPGGADAYADGYEIRFQQKGYVNVNKTSRPSTLASIGAGTVAMGATATTGGITTYRIVVSPTTIVISRTDAGGNANTYTVTDSAYRGGYMHIGKSDSTDTLNVSFSGITVQ